MILNIFDDFVDGISAGAGVVTNTGKSFILSILNGFLTALLNFLDFISEPFGFKLSEVLSSFADFCVGIFNFFKDFFSFVPAPFNSLFFLAFLFLFCLLIYKLIRG